MPQDIHHQIFTLLDSLNDDEKLRIARDILDYLLSDDDSLIEDLEETEDKPRRNLPRVANMLEWEILKTRDKLFVDGHPDKPALLLDKNTVAYDGEAMSINDWAKLITGWTAVNIYEHVRVERTGQLMDDMRRDYMDRL